MQIHTLAGAFPSDLLGLTRIGGELVTHFGQTYHVDLGACMLHAIQYLRYRQFDGLEQPELCTLIQQVRQHIRQHVDDGRMTLQFIGLRIRGSVHIIQIKCALRSLGRLLLEVQVKEVAGRLFKRFRVEIRMYQIARQLGVERADAAVPCSHAPP